MKREVIWSRIEEVIYKFDEKDIEETLKKQVSDINGRDTQFGFYYDECGAFKYAKLHVLYRKEDAKEEK